MFGSKAGARSSPVRLSRCRLRSRRFRWRDRNESISGKDRYVFSIEPKRVLGELAEIAKTCAVPVLRPVRKLDTVAAGFATSGIDLIKIDVQGLEHLVINGGAETLSRTTAVFAEVSFRPLYLGSSVFFDVYASLKAHGFMMVDLEPGLKIKSGELVQADALFAKPADWSTDE